jgi:putative ABC transport system permease protein
MDTLRQDIRYALRALGRNGRFAAIVILTLALAIGANTTIFSAVHALVLNPFAFGGAEQMVALQEDSEQCRACDIAPGNFLDWRERSASFSELAAYRGWTPNLSGTDAAEQVLAYQVTAGYFEMLEAEMELGRPFDAAAPGDQHSVVLAHGLWQRSFGADPRVVGTTVVLNGEPYVVSGVLRRHHQYPPQADLWVPLVFTSAEATNRVARYLGVVGRLRPGVSLETAQSELSTIAERLAHEHPESNSGWGVRAERFSEWAVSGPRPYVLLLLGAVAFLLLIACTNVANLLFAQATARGRELAVRTALGASRGRIVRQLLTESLVLAVLGGALGVLLAAWAVAALRDSLPVDLVRFLPGWASLQVDATVLGFTLLVSLIVGIACGLAPALSLSRPGLAGALKDGGRSTTGGARGGRARQLLVVAQVALALVLLAGTGLMVQSFVRMLRADPGFHTGPALTLQLALPPNGYDSGAAVAAFYDRLVERVAGLPGVEAAAVAGALPMTRTGGSQYFNVSGRPRLSVAEAPSAGYRVVSRDYLSAMGVPLKAGRAFTAEDGRDAPRVVLINQSFARRHFAGEDPVGQRLEFNDQSFEIVGVVGDVRHFGPREAVRPEMFAHHPQAVWRTMTLIARTQTPPLHLAAAVRAEIAELDRDVGVASVRSMEQVVADFLAPERVTTAQMAAFALIALLIAAIGIYGVMSYSVLQRTHEIGVRTALGARPTAVLAMIVRQGLGLTAVGVAIGLAGAFVVTRLMTSLLYDVTATDPLTLAAATAFLAVTALLASYLPARRAARIDPMVALRAD